MQCLCNSHWPYKLFPNLGPSSVYLRWVHHVDLSTAYCKSHLHYIQPWHTNSSHQKTHNAFSQFLTLNTSSGNKGCNDFPRASTCLIIQKQIDSGTTVWNTKICKRRKLWGKATKEGKRSWREEHMGAHSDLLACLSVSICFYRRRKGCEVTG